MAQAIGESIAPQHKHESAGTFGAAHGDPASPHAYALFPVLTQHESRQVTAAMLASADLVIAMTQGNANALPGIRREDHVLDVSDPYGADLATYKETAEEIREALTKILTPPSMWQRIVATFRGWDYYREGSN
jgi:protein-tyrosine-phosphatase